MYMCTYFKQMVCFWRKLFYSNVPDFIHAQGFSYENSSLAKIFFELSPILPRDWEQTFHPQSFARPWMQGLTKLHIYKIVDVVHGKTTCSTSAQKWFYFNYFTCFFVAWILKVVRNLFQTFHLNSAIWFRDIEFTLYMHNVKAVHCPLLSDCPLKSSQWLCLSQLANSAGSWYIVTALHIAGKY